MKKSPQVLISAVILLWLITAFLVWPNINLLFETFAPEGKFSVRPVEKLLSSDRAMQSLANSFLLAIALSITTNMVGVFIVLVTRYFRILGSRVLWLGYATTFIYGGIVLAAGYKFIYGNKGILTIFMQHFFPSMDPNWFTGFWAVLFTMTLACTTNHMLFVSAALEKIDQQTIEAAKNMGAGTWTILFRVVLPTLLPVVLAVTILSFLTGLGALSAPQILGGRDFQTIAPMVLTFANSASSRDLAALLALILGAVTIALLAAFNRFEKRGMYFSVSKVSSTLEKQRIDSPFANIVVHILAYALFVLYVAPVILIILFSFMSPAAVGTGTLNFASLSLENYTRVLSEGNSLRPFMISIGYAGFAALTVTVLMLFTSRILVKYRGRLTAFIEYLLHIPWILPTTLIALGLIMSYDHPTFWLLGWVPTGTPYILAIAYVIVKIPFTLRLLKSAFMSVNTSLEETATLLGAHPLYTFCRVILPSIIPATAAVTALNFNSLLDDYDAAVFLAHPLCQPLGLAIKANTEGNTGPEAQANTFVYTVLLMIIAGLTMYLIYGRSSKAVSRKKK